VSYRIAFGQVAGYSRWLAGAPELNDNFAPRMLEITICTIVDTDAIVPLNGEPEAIAEELAGYAALGVSHIQISLEPTTLEAIENLARAIELLKQT